jgi:hypothetical protein
MYGWELRERRLAAKLTLAQVARASGTAESNVSAYERGTKAMRPDTQARMVSMIDCGAHSSIHRLSLLTVPATAAAIRTGVRSGASTAELLRLVRQMLSDAGELEQPDRTAFFAHPSTSGDQRWDALLAGVVEDAHLACGEPAPTWTHGHALPTFWFVGQGQAMRAYAFARSPFSLHVRGVMLDPDELVAV